VAPGKQSPLARTRLPESTRRVAGSPHSSCRAPSAHALQRTGFSSLDALSSLWVSFCVRFLRFLQSAIRSSLGPLTRVISRDQQEHKNRLQTESALLETPTIAIHARSHGALGTESANRRPISFGPSSFFHVQSCSLHDQRQKEPRRFFGRERRVHKKKGQPSMCGYPFFGSLAPARIRK
jgi:hypothetical protein